MCISNVLVHFRYTPHIRPFRLGRALFYIILASRITQYAHALSH